jgi:hypothetical protein
MRRLGQGQHGVPANMSNEDIIREFETDYLVRPSFFDLDNSQVSPVDFARRRDTRRFWVVRLRVDQLVRPREVGTKPTSYARFCPQNIRFGMYPGRSPVIAELLNKWLAGIFAVS